MPHTDNYWNDDYRQLENTATEYKDNLDRSLKAQVELEKKLSKEKQAHKKSQTKHKEEKSKLIKRISNLSENVDRLETHSDMLDNSLAAAQQKIKALESDVEAQVQHKAQLEEYYQTLIKEKEAAHAEEIASREEAYKQLSMELQEKIERNEALESQINELQTAPPVLSLLDDGHFDHYDSLTDEEPVVVEKPAVAEAKPEPTPVSTSFSIFQNPATKALSEITKARIAEALAEKAREKQFSRF